MSGHLVSPTRVLRVENALGLEGQQSIIARIRNVSDRQMTFTSERAAPVFIRGKDTEIHDGVVQVCAQAHFQGRASDPGVQ